jgi:hypothetical protein
VRTTLTLDPDVASELERRRREGLVLRREVNRLLRIGLLHDGEDAPPPRRGPYTTPSALGPSLVGSLDDIAAVLARVEGDDHR